MNTVAGRVELEAAHTGGLGRIFYINDVVTTTVVDRVDVLVVDEHVMYAAVQLVVVASDYLNTVSGIRNVEDDEAVLAVRSPFPAESRPPSHLPTP